VFVHADISFDREISAEVVELETATLGSVRVVHEGEHEFVRTPIIESGGRTTVRLTFRTRDVVEEFSRGSHDVAVTGVFGDLSFASIGELTIV
jgi:hypothetical protein